MNDTMRIRTNGIEGFVLTVDIDVEQCGLKGLRKGDSVYSSPFSDGIYPHAGASGVEAHEAHGICLDDWYPHNHCIVIEDES